MLTIGETGYKVCEKSCTIVSIFVKNLKIIKNIVYFKRKINIYAKGNKRI